MKHIISIILAATTCTSCASINSAPTNNTDQANTALQTKLYIAEGQGCSLPTDVAVAGEQEALGTALAAALVPKLVNSGIDFLSAALRKASGEDDKDLSVSSNETGAFLYKLGPARLGAAVNVERKCIRAVVAGFPLEHDPMAVKLQPDITSSTLNSDVSMKAAISTWLGKSSTSSFTPHFYIEYEVNPAIGRTFTIEPVLIWYPKEVFGDKYKLVSLELTAQTAPAAEKAAFQYTTVFNQKDGQSAGIRLGRADLTGLQKRLFEGPALSTARSSLRDTYVKTLTDLAGQVVLDDNAKMAYDLAKMRAEKAAFDCMETAKGKESSSGSAITQHEKLSCERTYGISIKTAENTFAIVSNKLDALNSQKTSVGGALFAPDGAVNFTFKMTETTKPNKFLLALSDALTSSKADIQPAISRVFLGPQRSDQDRIDSFSDEWDYQTKASAYSVAKAEYTALIEKIDPPATAQEISTAFDNYRQTGKELGELAIKLGRPLPD